MGIEEKLPSGVLLTSVLRSVGVTNISNHIFKGKRALSLI